MLLQTASGDSHWIFFHRGKNNNIYHILCSAIIVLTALSTSLVVRRESKETHATIIWTLDNLTYSFVRARIENITQHWHFWGPTCIALSLHRITLWIKCVCYIDANTEGQELCAVSGKKRLETHEDTKWTWTGPSYLAHVQWVLIVFYLCFIVFTTPNTSSHHPIFLPYIKQISSKRPWANASLA